MSPIEPLEPRRLLTATLAAGVLTVTGTPGNDQINISRSKSGKLTVTEKVISVSGNVTTITTLPKTVVDFSAVTSVVVKLGDGNDTITLTGGKGNPFVTASTVEGGAGNDSVTSGNGNDVLRGGGGDDRLTAGGGNDSLHGDDGNDRLYGNDGDDRLYGSFGGDQLTGGNGADLLDGGLNNDKLYADDGVIGNDTVEGGGADIPAKPKRTSGDYAVIDVGDLILRVRRVETVHPD
jgi:Ca2+-binding RTX toxin-like protein